MDDRDHDRNRDRDRDHDRPTDDYDRDHDRPTDDYDRDHDRPTDDYDPTFAGDHDPTFAGDRDPAGDGTETPVERALLEESTTPGRHAGHAAGDGNEHGGGGRHRRGVDARVLLSPAVGAPLMSLSTVVFAVNARFLGRVDLDLPSLPDVSAPTSPGSAD